MRDKLKLNISAIANNDPLFYSSVLKKRCISSKQQLSSSFGQNTKVLQSACNELSPTNIGDPREYGQVLPFGVLLISHIVIRLHVCLIKAKNSFWPSIAPWRLSAGPWLTSWFLPLRLNKTHPIPPKPCHRRYALMTNCCPSCFIPKLILVQRKHSIAELYMKHRPYQCTSDSSFLLPEPSFSTLIWHKFFYHGTTKICEYRHQIFKYLPSSPCSLRTNYWFTFALGPPASYSGSASYLA